MHLVKDSLRIVSKQFARMRHLILLQNSSDRALIYHWRMSLSHGNRIAPQGAQCHCPLSQNSLIIDCITQYNSTRDFFYALGKKDLYT